MRLFELEAPWNRFYTSFLQTARYGLKEIGGCTQDGPRGVCLHRCLYHPCDSARASAGVGKFMGRQRGTCCSAQMSLDSVTTRGTTALQILGVPGESVIPGQPNVSGSVPLYSLDFYCFSACPGVSDSPHPDPLQVISCEEGI